MSAEQVPTWRSLLSQAQEVTNGRRGDRCVDFGVELRVVHASATGICALPGKPPIDLLRHHRLGGRWDRTLRQFVGPAVDPVVWYVSERQEAVILDIDGGKTRTLLYSAEGGGKTVTAAMWCVVQVIRLATAGIFVAGGATAPTHERLQTLVKAICERVPTDTARDRRAGAWATYYSDQRELRWVTGHVTQCRSTKKASAATGSPVQGMTWAFSVDDELQDSVENGADPDIEARMRGARVSRRLGTATAKDSPAWRTFRDSKLSTPDWKIERIQYHENPFVWPEHWERMQRLVSPREWQRRGLAMDVGPERMVYVAWDRAKNLRPVPQVGAQDVTRSELAGYGPLIDVLVGHDPGKLCDVSVILKAYRLSGSGLTHWWVVDELTTDNTTTEQHVDVLVKRLRDRWGVNRMDLRNRPMDGSPLALVRADPYGDSDAKPDRSIYTIFRRAGLDIRPAAYSTVRQDAMAKPTPGRIDRDARIEVVNSLFCNAAGERRLFIACDERRVPAAPKLLEAIELSEREEGTGKAEVYRKGRASDLSHWPSALGYALWSVEKPRMRAAGAGA